MSKTTIKSRLFCILFAVIVVLGLIPSTIVSAYSSLNGGYAKVISSCDVMRDGSVVISLDPGEGVTVLNNSGTGNTVLIECNTLDGPQTGYVLRDALDSQGNCPDSVYGYVHTSGSTYYTPDYNNSAGYIYAGENVAVLRRSGSWVYIEYNVSDGMRKRAYTLASNITFSTLSNSKPKNSFYQDDISGYSFTVSSNKTVYSGPNGATYAACGSISSVDNGHMRWYKSFSDRDGDIMYYISYPNANGEIKYGYVYAFLNI